MTADRGRIMALSLHWYGAWAWLHPAGVGRPRRCSQDDEVLKGYGLARPSANGARDDLLAWLAAEFSRVPAPVQLDPAFILTNMVDPAARGRRYEQWAAGFMKARVPDGLVKHNARLQGRSGLLRQVDVLVTASFPGLSEPQQLVVECKAWHRPVPIGEVGKLRDLMDDVGAPLGLLLTPTGFTKGAVKRAAELPGIMLEV